MADEVAAVPAEADAPAPEGQDTPAEPPKPAAPPPPQKFKRKLKLDGGEEEVEATEDELWAHFRKGKAADRRFEENAAARKKLEEERKAFEAERAALRSEDPIGAMARLLGVDRAEAQRHIENTLYGQYKEEELSPVERENRALKREKAERERSEKEAAAKKEAEERQAKDAAETERITKEWDKTFTAALQLPDVALPRTDHTLAYMAEYVRDANKAGYEPDPREVALAVRERFDKEHDALLASLTPENVLQRYPKLSALIRKADLERIRKKLGGAPAPAEAAAPARERDQTTGQFVSGQQPPPKPARAPKPTGPTDAMGRRIVKAHEEW
jgi:hypothetical protein